MDIPFFYAPDITLNGKYYRLDEASSRHCVQVLRKKVGDIIMLTDGKGSLCKAVIEIIEKKKCIAALTEIEEVNSPLTKTGIGISFTKNISRIEWFLEKATEIGITDIYPLQCHRMERIKYNNSRLKNILVAAMLQSQQVYIPVLHEQISFDEIINIADRYHQKFIAYCVDDDKHFFEKKLLSGKSSLILIGPEGDFTPEEIKAAKDAEFIPVSLGKTRLRTETAGVVACTLMRAVNEK